MPQQIRLWEVTRDQTLAGVPSSEINLEEQLESWLESDISLLDEDLLVIGRQVETAFGGFIDLLCLDSAGDTVVIELKRHQTPRDVTAQVLDYASWVKDLSSGKIMELADKYFGEVDSLPTAFAERFGDELPSALNQQHRSLIVAATIDGNTERIVQYLADLDVPINVATVQHFVTEDGKEMLAQVYLVEPQPGMVVSRPSKRVTTMYMTINGLQDLANAQGIGHLYGRLRAGVRRILSAQAYSETVGYRMKLEDGRVRTVLLVNAVAEVENHLGFTLHASRFMDYWDVKMEEIQSWLPDDVQEQTVSAWVGSSPEERQYALGFSGYFRTEQEIDNFVQGLRNNAP